MTTEATWFHCSAKPISRGAGRSAVAAAAYRLAACLEDREYGLVHDYSRRGGVVTAFTLAPANVPGWVFDPEQLWNAVEVKENRKNSQLALEWEVALPNELDGPKRESIAREFSQWLVDSYGVAVTTGIHTGDRRGNGMNDHMHVMMTTREIGPDGWAKNKLRDFNCRPGQSNPKIDQVRERMAAFINAALEKAGSVDRVTHLSFEARGIDREPTKHLGPSASEMERRDPGSSDRGDRNRDIGHGNQSLDQLVAELAAVNAEIAAIEEQRLDARFGPPEPDKVPELSGPIFDHRDGNQATVSPPPERSPPQAMAASFDAAIRPAITAGKERLDDLYGPEEPAAPPSRHRPPEVPLLSPEPAPLREKMAASFEATIRPAIASVRQTGESWFGARLWQKTVDLYQRGAEMVANLTREALGSWQRFIQHDREPGYDHDYEPEQERGGPER